MPKAYNDVDPLRLVCWGNLSRLEHHGVSGILIELQLTKTIQCGERIQQIPLACNNTCPLLCSVREIKILRNIIGDRNIPQIHRCSKPKITPAVSVQFFGDSSKTGSMFHGGIQQCIMSMQNLDRPDRAQEGVCVVAGQRNLLDPFATLNCLGEL